MQEVKVTYDDMMHELFNTMSGGKLRRLAQEISNLVVAKNHDYGSAWERYGIFTPLIRINDKILRVKTLSGGEQALVADEKIEDTLKDIIGYATLALLWLKENNKDEDTKDVRQFSFDNIDFPAVGNYHGGHIK